MEKKAKSFVKGAAILMVAGLLVKIIGAVYRIPLTNIVGAEGMSFYEIAYPYYSWLLVISSAGLPTAISKFVAERVACGNYRGAYSVFRVALILLVGIGIFTSLLMFVLSDVLAGVSGLPAAALSLKALAPALFFVSVMCAYRGYLQGLQRMTGTAVSQIIEQVFKLIVGFSLAKVLLPKGPEYAAMGALIGVSVSELIALIVIYFVYRYNKKRVIDVMLADKAVEQRESGRRIAFSLIKFAIPITLGASIMPITGIADSAMIINTLTKIGFPLSSAQVAYSILRSNVTVLINMPAVLTMALAMSLVPAISEKMKQGDRHGVIAASKMGMKLALVIGAPCAVGLFVLAKPIIALLFTRLSPQQLSLAEDLMHTAAIGVIFLSAVQTLTGIIQGFGKAQVPVVNLVIGGVMKIIVMVILMRIPNINIQGAAISTVVCYAVAAILDVIYLIRSTRMKFSAWDLFIKPIFASIVMGVITHLTYSVLTNAGHTRLATLGAIAVAVLVYAILAVALKMFSKQDLEFVPGGRKLAKLLRCK